MATIKKSLSAKVTNEHANVHFRLSVSHSVSFRLKTSVFVPVKCWNTKKGAIKIPDAISQSLCDELKSAKNKLDNLEEKVLDLVRLFPNDICKEWLEKVLPLVESIDAGEMNEQNVLAAIERHEHPELEMQRTDMFYIGEIFLKKKNFSLVRTRLFRVLFRSASRYKIFANEVKKEHFDWNINKVTKEDMEKFFDYVMYESVYRTKHVELFDRMLKEYPMENTPKHKTIKFHEHSENYMVDVRKRMRAFWNWLREQKYTTNNPLESVSIGTEHYGTPFYLTIEERNKIAEFDFSNNAHLETQRDIFVFQCLVGCRVGDLYTFKKENIENGILIYAPHKTKDENNSFTARVPLNARAKALIEKYDGKDRKGMLFPFVSTQKYNDAIKTILKMCEIKRNVVVRNSLTGENEIKALYEVASSHMARRTFVGNAYKVVKDPNLIGRMSGHVEGSKAFVRYRDIDDDMLKDVINAIQ